VETVGNAAQPGLPGLRIIVCKSGKPDLHPRRSCKDHLHPCAVPVVPRVGFEPTSPRLQRGAFTRLASSANWSGRWEIEPIVPTLATWCSAIELRPHGGKWKESNLLPAGTAFTARRRHQPVLMTLPKRKAVHGRLFANWLRAPGLHRKSALADLRHFIQCRKSGKPDFRAVAAYETAWVPKLTDLSAHGAEAFNSLACCRYFRGQQNDGGCLTCRSPHPVVPSRFERAPEAALDRHPCWRKAAVSIRSGEPPDRFPSDADRPTPGLDPGV
jgi:hypothetical protein